MEITTGNSLLDGIILVAGGIGVGWWATSKSPEQVATQDREKVRQHELELAQAEAAKIRSANEATVALMAQKHDSFRRAAESMAKSFHNSNIDPCDAQAAMAALAKNFGIMAEMRPALQQHRNPQGFLLAAQPWVLIRTLLDGTSSAQILGKIPPAPMHKGFSNPV